MNGTKQYENGPQYGTGEQDALNWVDAYASHTGSPFIDYGSSACVPDGDKASGLSPNYHNPECNSASDNDERGWDEQLQYDLTDGISPGADSDIKAQVKGTPQVYYDGQAEQWDETAHFAAAASVPFSYLGILDQGGDDSSFSNSAAWTHYIGWLKTSSATRFLVPRHSMSISS